MTKSTRVLDVTLLVLTAPISVPLVLLGACLVRAFDGPPSFYPQQRVGRGGTLFQIYKLRTMTPGPGGQITYSGDLRVTRFGHILRASKFDELPQLWNVLTGTMSLVGPRPEVPSYLEELQQHPRLLALRPGLTDLASVAFVHEEVYLSGLIATSDDHDRVYRTHLQEKLRLNEWFACDPSPGRYLKILVLTAVSLGAPARARSVALRLVASHE